MNWPRRQTQADWLAESGIECAAARLAADPKYRGETWNVSAAELGGRDDGTVAIRVEDLPGRPGSRAIRVEADYATDPAQRTRLGQTAIIELPPK